MASLKELSQYLAKRSTEICADNKCMEDNHNCGSYAYLIVEFYPGIGTIKDARLLDICLPDYFQGDARCNCALALPFNGDENDLKRYINIAADID